MAGDGYRARLSRELLEWREVAEFSDLEKQDGEGSQEKRVMQTFEFFCTFGDGQPNHPGYALVRAEGEDVEQAESKARRKISEETNGRWCGTYRSLDDVHPNDRILRFTI